MSALKRYGKAERGLSHFQKCVAAVNMTFAVVTLAVVVKVVAVSIVVIHQHGRAVRVIVRVSVELCGMTMIAVQLGVMANGLLRQISHS